MGTLPIGTDFYLFIYIFRNKSVVEYCPAFVLLLGFVMCFVEVVSDRVLCSLQQDVGGSGVGGDRGAHHQGDHVRQPHHGRVRPRNAAGESVSAHTSHNTLFNSQEEKQTKMH